MRPTTDTSTPDLVTPAATITTEAAVAYYFDAEDSARAAVTALRTTPDPRPQADHLRDLADAACRQAAVAHQVYGPEHADYLHPDNAAQDVATTIDDARIALLLAALAENRATTTPRTPRWPELDTAAAHTLNTLADPTATVHDLAEAYHDLADILADLGLSAEHAHLMGTVLTTFTHPDTQHPTQRG